MQDNSEVRITQKSNETIKFEVYTNYLWGLSYFLKKKYKNYSEIGKSIVCQGDKSENGISLMRKYLHNAWNSERILNLPRELDADTFFIKFANHWSPILGYYSIFLCFQALLIALGIEPILEHASFLSKVSSLMKKRSLLFIYPWNLLCWGCSYYQEEKFNFEVNLSDVNALSPLRNFALADESCFMAKILRTTRLKDEVYREKKWKKDGEIKGKNGFPKKRYAREDKEKVSHAVSPTSIFNFLYRLRIRSNYEDADIFFIGERSNIDINNYFNSIVLITDYTMFFIETILKQTIGREKFMSLSHLFVSNSGNYQFGVINRRKYH